MYNFYKVYILGKHTRLNRNLECIWRKYDAVKKTFSCTSIINLWLFRFLNHATFCVPSATRHNIYMYPYFLFAAIHHLKSSLTFSERPCSSVGRVTVDLFRRSWVRFPPKSKDFFFAWCGSLFPFARADAQWVIRGFR